MDEKENSHMSPPQELKTSLPAALDSKSNDSTCDISSIAACQPAALPKSPTPDVPRRVISKEHKKSNIDMLLENTEHSLSSHKTVEDKSSNSNTDASSNLASGNHSTSSSGHAGLGPVPLYTQLTSNARNSGKGYQRKMIISTNWVDKAELSLKSYVESNPSDTEIEKEILQIGYYRGLVNRGQDLTSEKMERCRQIIRLADRRRLLIEQSDKENRQRAERDAVSNTRKCFWSKNTTADSENGEKSDTLPRSLSFCWARKTGAITEEHLRGALPKSLSSASLGLRSCNPHEQNSNFEPASNTVVADTADEHRPTYAGESGLDTQATDDDVSEVDEYDSDESFISESDDEGYADMWEDLYDDNDIEEEEPVYPIRRWRVVAEPKLETIFEDSEEE